jgi:hypothetical protein
MKRRLVSAGVALLLVVCLTPGLTLAAAAVLDQHNDTADDLILTHGTYAQTFTVGKTGTIKEIALWMYMNSGTENVTVYIEPVASGHPNGTHLASGSATLTTTDAFVAFPVTAHAVTAGEHLAIVFTLSTNANVHTLSGTLYGSGQAGRAGPTRRGGRDAGTPAVGGPGAADQPGRRVWCADVRVREGIDLE